MLKPRMISKGLISIINVVKHPRECLFFKSDIFKNSHFIHGLTQNCNNINEKSKFDKVLFCKQLYSFNCRRTITSLNNEKLERYLKNITVDVLHSEFKISHDHLVLNLLKEKEKLEENLHQLSLMKENEGTMKDGKEMLKLIEEDLKQCTEQLNKTYKQILEYLVPKGDFEDCDDIVLEIFAGVGGLEAMLFASELQSMYCSFFDYKGWQYSLAECDESELGGLRHCSLLVSGPKAYSTLHHEAGVHRVQRVPATEKGGRVHTSTVSVAVLPQPSDVEINLKDSDLKIETKRASGAGGQHVNTTDSAVRVTHIPTGIAVECQTGRSQIQNKATAIRRLQAKLYEKELNQIDSNIRSQRKTQVGTSSRSEKIRTYNFRDDRISDHRMSINVHNLREFLKGRESLEKLLNLLNKWHHDSQLRKFIDNLPS